LADGKHHVAPGGALIDEDSWFAVYSDSWDEKGRLWKFGHGTMYLVPEFARGRIGQPVCLRPSLGGYVYGFAFNDEPVQYKITRRIPRVPSRPHIAAQAVR